MLCQFASYTNSTSRAQCVIMLATLLLAVARVERIGEKGPELAAAAAKGNWSWYRSVLDQHAHRNSWGAAVAMRVYLYDWHHPGVPHGVGCAELERLGASGGEAGKPVCDVQSVLAPPCLVVSVGSNGDTAFEADVHRRAPHCVIETWDGTLTGRRQRLRERIPSFVHYHAENWGAQSWRRYADRSVSLFKMDCEGSVHTRLS